MAPRAKSPAGYQIGIVNPLTLVGSEIQTILRERSYPFAKIVLLDSSGKAAGALTAVDDEPAVVTAISDDELEDLDLAFFCGPASSNREWIERHAEDSFIAVDLSQPSSVENGRLAVAGMNLDDLGAGERVLISPHPIAIPMAMVLHEIGTLSRIESCVASVVQPASEFGKAGVEELAQQAISVLNVRGVTKEVFDRQIAFNLYPAPERNEEFVADQIRTLTGGDAEIALFVTQGTIFHGHTFALFVKTRDELTVEQIESRLRDNPAIALPEGDQAFGTIDAAGKDEILVAEVRHDAAIRGGVWVWAACDNLRRSSALNAVLVAEKVLLEAGAN